MKETVKVDLLKFVERLVANIKKCDEGRASIEATTVSAHNVNTGFVEHACNGERVYQFKIYTAAEDKRAELFTRCGTPKKDEFYPTDKEMKELTEEKNNEK